ncbi:MAG: nitroreductase family protein [Pseudomonadota bacterium]|nr:nitroreductase family protein [Pseudomonadota bacterium]
MKLMESLSGRRAVRDFLPEPVDPEVLLELVAAASNAPSYLNQQPWSFSLSAEPATVSELSRRAKQHLLASLRRRSPFFGQREQLEAPEHELFYGAPALIVVCATQTGALADAGCAMAAYAIMLAAHSMGLGSCWVSTALPWLDSGDGRKALGIPPDYRPIAPIILGGPAGAPLSPGRFEPRVHWIPQAAAPA